MENKLVENNFENNEKTFPIFKILLRKSLIIILVTVLCALIGLGYAIVKTKPSYTASRSVIFRTEIKDGGNLSNNQTSQVSLAKLYLSSVSSIIRSDAIMTKSQDNLLATSNAIINATEDFKKLNGTPPTAKEIADELSISVSHVEDVQAIIADSESGKFNAKNVGMDYKETSLIFTLSYTDKNENFACAKLDVLVDTIAENLGDYVQAANVTLISTQHENDVSISFNRAKFVILGAGVGLFATVTIVLLAYALDNTLKSKEELAEITGVDVLSMIEK